MQLSQQEQMLAAQTGNNVELVRQIIMSSFNSELEKQEQEVPFSIPIWNRSLDLQEVQSQSGGCCGDFQPSVWGYRLQKSHFRPQERCFCLEWCYSWRWSWFGIFLKITAIILDSWGDYFWCFPCHFWGSDHSNCRFYGEDHGRLHYEEGIER